jgi:hypothetical protein
MTGIASPLYANLDQGTSGITLETIAATTLTSMTDTQFQNTATFNTVVSCVPQ